MIHGHTEHVYRIDPVTDAPYLTIILREYTEGVIVEVLSLETIQQYIMMDALLADIEQAFVNLSAGKMTSPPVGLLTIPDGITHIKYGHIQGDDVFVIKIASSYHGNIEKGLPSGNGMMLVLDAHTGQTLAVLDDKGWLTDVRTALAGAIAVKQFAPTQMRGVGIIGTGVQARLQAEFTKPFMETDHVFLWGRDAERQSRCVKDITEKGCAATACDLETLAHECNVIITTTPATSPLLRSDWVADDTLIVAVGADAPGKQEIESALVERCVQIVCDKVDQCLDHGELQRVHRAGKLEVDRIRELGDVIQTGGQARDCLTLVDLTGVAAQDIAIAQHVYNRWRRCTRH